MQVGSLIGRQWKRGNDFLLKRCLRRSLRVAGFELVRRTVDRWPDVQLAQIIKDLRVELVVDVGANVGQFAMTLRSNGYSGRIISFEPLTNAHNKLCETAKRDPRWIVHPRCAVGALDETRTLNIAGNSVSSSLLSISTAHVDAAPASAQVGTESVEVRRLDTLLPPYCAEGSRYFLKIDTQGYEWEVLAGGTNAVKDSAGLLVEMSLIPLYAGQHLWREIIDCLEQQGFDLWALLPGFTDPVSGRTLQVDGLFTRKEWASSMNAGST